MLTGCRNVPPLISSKPTRIDRERDDHAEQPEVDLGLREEAAPAGPRGDRSVLTLGARPPRSPRDPPGRRWNAPARPWDTQGRGYTSDVAPVTRTLLAVAGTLAVSTPSQICSLVTYQPALITLSEIVLE